MYQQIKYALSCEVDKKKTLGINKWNWQIIVM